MQDIIKFKYDSTRYPQDTEIESPFNLLEFKAVAKHRSMHIHTISFSQPLFYQERTNIIGSMRILLNENEKDSVVLDRLPFDVDLFTYSRDEGIEYMASLLDIYFVRVRPDNSILLTADFVAAEYLDWDPV